MKTLQKELLGGCAQIVSADGLVEIEDFVLIRMRAARVAESCCLAIRVLVLAFEQNCAKEGQTHAYDDRCSARTNIGIVVSEQGVCVSRWIGAEEGISSDQTEATRVVAEKL